MENKRLDKNGEEVDKYEVNENKPEDECLFDAVGQEETND
jgi:hypothetical protein